MAYQYTVSDNPRWLIINPLEVVFKAALMGDKYEVIDQAEFDALAAKVRKD
ncbi:MAG: hypothetical protein P8I62_03625 [Pseudomonadales bacterium]|nr:hypothetical protein [Pseudomonadales bacterium]